MRLGVAGSLRARPTGAQKTNFPSGRQRKNSNPSHKFAFSGMGPAKNAGNGGFNLEAGIYPNTKNIVLNNLTPGAIYNVRIRAVGGSTHYSPWSATVSIMST